MEYSKDNLKDLANAVVSLSQAVQGPMDLKLLATELLAAELVAVDFKEQIIAAKQVLSDAEVARNMANDELQEGIWASQVQDDVDGVDLLAADLLAVNIRATSDKVDELLAAEFLVSDVLDQIKVAKERAAQVLIDAQVAQDFADGDPLSAYIHQIVDTIDQILVHL